MRWKTYSTAWLCPERRRQTVRQKDDKHTEIYWSEWLCHERSRQTGSQADRKKHNLSAWSCHEKKETETNRNKDYDKTQTEGFTWYIMLSQSRRSYYGIKVKRGGRGRQRQRWERREWTDKTARQTGWDREKQYYKWNDFSRNLALYITL